MKKHINIKRQTQNHANDNARDMLNFLNESKVKDKKFEWKLPKVIGLDGKYTDIKNVLSAEDYKAYDSVQQRYNQINSAAASMPQLVSNLMDTGFIGYAALSNLLVSNGILDATCDSLATEMFRKWIRFIKVDDTDNDSDNDTTAKRIKELEKEFERLDVRGIFKKATYQTFAYGGSYVFPAIGDVDYTNPDEAVLEELQSELIIDDVKINKGDLKYLTVIEPMWVVPIRYDTTNPFSEFFYKPEYFSVMGKTTHYTRLLKFIYNEAPDIYKPTYLFNGVPLMQYQLPYVSDFETIRRTITKIVQRYNLNVLKTNIERILASGDQEAISNLKLRLQVFNSMRDNTGVLALDFETEDFMQLSMTLSGLKELESQAAEYMCIIPKMPATKLLGQTPQGFNSNGDYEMTSFYDMIMSLNNEIVRPQLIPIMHMAMLNLWGEIDKNIKFEFNELEEMNEKETAEINEIKARTDATLQSTGAIDTQDIQERIRTDTKSGYNGLEQRERELVNDITREFVENNGKV